MNTSLRARVALLAGVCLVLTPWAAAQTSSSTSPSTTSSPSTTTPNAATTATNPTMATNAASATTTTPQAAAPNVPVPPQVQGITVPPVTNPAGQPVVPPTAQPVTAPGAVTQRSGATAPGQVVQPPGAQATVDANGQLVPSGASIDALASAGVETSVDPQNALTNLRRANASGQAGVTAELQTRVDATNRALTELRAQSRANGLPISSSELDQITAEIRTREDMLRETLRNAAISNSESEWRQLQSMLDSQYSAYADAVLRAQRLMQRPQN